MTHTVIGDKQER